MAQAYYILGIKSTTFYKIFISVMSNRPFQPGFRSFQPGFIILDTMVHIIFVHTGPHTDLMNMLRMFEISLVNKAQKSLIFRWFLF